MCRSRRRKLGSGRAGIQSRSHLSLFHPDAPGQGDVSVRCASSDGNVVAGVLFDAISNVKLMHCDYMLGSCQEICMY